MIPRRVERAKALFIGGPLDWTVREVEIPEKLHIMDADKIHCYHRRLIDDTDVEGLREDDLLVTYIHETEVEELSKPKRFMIFLNAWFDAIDDEDLAPGAIGIAHGIVTANHEFNQALNRISKKWGPWKRARKPRSK